MSKIGKQPVKIPAGVEVKLDDGALTVKGKLGTLALPVLEFVKAKFEGDALIFEINGSGKQARANWGTMRALAANAVKGVSEGFMKLLEIEGIGFRASMDGKNLTLNIGFSHPVKFAIPDGVTVSVEKGVIRISGSDRALVGKVAADIRSLKKPEPYKGTGIRYQGEVIRRKAGKKVAGAGAAAA